MAVFIALNAVNVMTQNTNSTVSIGTNLQSGWDSHQKQNSAVGPINGNSLSMNCINSQIDPDANDMFVNDADFKPGAQAQTA